MILDPCTLSNFYVLLDNVVGGYTGGLPCKKKGVSIVPFRG